jgi:type IV secretion system protein TrbG
MMMHPTLLLATALAIVVGGPWAMASAPTDTVSAITPRQLSTEPRREDANHGKVPYADATSLHDSRNVKLTFDAERIIPLLAHVGEITHVELAVNDGAIVRVMLGVRDFWDVVPHPPAGSSPARLFLKPNKEDVSTSATVVMASGRVYEFRLISVREGGYRYQRVSFRYPADEQAALVAEAAQVRTRDTEERQRKAIELAPPDPALQLNFAYDINGDAAFRPVAVFDNGKFTTVILPRHIPTLPVVFMKEDDQLQLVDYVPLPGADGWVHRIQVQRLVSGLVLRLNGKEVQIARQVARTPSKWWRDR